MTVHLHTHWNALAVRERTLILVALLTIGAALLWQVLLGPALKTLRQAPARHAALDAQWQRMHTLQAQAQQLQQAPKPRAGEARSALQSSLSQQLGQSAQFSSNGMQATITLTHAPAVALANWLAQVRSMTHATPLQAQLTHSTPAHWNGTLILALPAE